MVRPKPLNEASAASIGALLMLATGLVSLPQAFDVLTSTANVLLFFIGLMVVSAVADQGKFFEWSASRSLSFAGGDGRKLLLVIFVLGALVTAFFSNDATALVLTPIVYVLVTRLKLNPLPFVFACAFVANTASVLLPISNPVNLLAVDRFGLGIGEYLSFLLVPAVLALAINFAMFRLIFRKSIPATFVIEPQSRPVKVDSFFRYVCTGLGLTAAGYIVALIYRLPVSIPAIAGAALLAIGGFAHRRIKLKMLGSSIQWTILLFILSLAILVRGLDNVGITRALGEAVAAVAGRGALEAIAAVTVVTAFGSNLINNWPMMMISVSSLGSVGNPAPAFDRSLVYSAIIGADLGPNIAILGSLSSMMWLVLLRRRGLVIHPIQYLKLGLLVTPPMLAAGALSVYATAVLRR